MTKRAHVERVLCIAAAILVAGCAHTPEPDLVNARDACMSAYESYLKEQASETGAAESDGFCAIDANGVGVLRTPGTAIDDPDYELFILRCETSLNELRLLERMERLRAGGCAIDSDGVQVVPGEPGASDGK